MLTFDEPMGRSELARALGTTRQNLWNQEQAGRLPPPDVQVGRRMKFGPAAQMLAADLVAGSRA
jgi:hypothetical protein